MSENNNTQIVSIEEFNSFCKKYFNSEMKKNLRFGQAFMNEFCSSHMEGKPDPELYYMENNELAKMLARDRYVGIKLM